MGDPLRRYFDRVVMLTLEGREGRCDRALAGMAEVGLDAGQVRIEKGWNGEELPAPAWWRAGNGAWGCLMSHHRALADAYRHGVKRLLVLEDDCCFQADAVRMLEEFLPAVPEGWGQLYLGGVHQARPQELLGRPEVFRGLSVNRTHAYAVARGWIPRVLAHIMHAPDYMGAPFPAHLDHQLERAHQREDWPVYAPTWWVCGQEENDSDINGRHHPRKWWQWASLEAVRALPVIELEGDGTPAEEAGIDAERIHCGWEFEHDGRAPRGLGVDWREEDKLPAVLDQLAREALEQQRLPAVAPPHHRARLHLRKCWPGPVLKMREHRGALAELCDYPHNGLFPHAWLNPEGGAE